MKCDFCASPHVVCAFNAPDMAVGVLSGVEIDPKWASVGAWSACESCAVLLESGRHEELANKGVRSSGEKFTAEQHRKCVQILMAQYNHIDPLRVSIS